MAVINGEVGFRLKDSKKAVTSLPVYFVSSTGLLADMITAINTAMPLLDAITESQLLPPVLRIRIPLVTGLKSAPVTGADNEDAALFDYATVSGNPWGQSVPALVTAKFDSNQPKYVNLSDTDITAWTGEMIGGNTGFAPSDRYYTDITGVLSGIAAFRKHRRAVRAAK